MAQSVGEEGFPDADRSHDEHVVGVRDEPQRGQLGPELPVVGDLGRLVPGVEVHPGVQVRGLGAQQR